MQRVRIKEPITNRQHKRKHIAMKNVFITGILFIFFNSLYAQVDSLTNTKDTGLVKGFYKTYQEFLANKPSIILNFSTTLLTASKNDPTVIGAKYEIPDSVDYIGDVWGFCDGRNVFIANGTFSAMKYWKLQCRGPNPYYFYWHKDFFLLFPIMGIVSVVGAVVASASLPPDAELMFIDKNGITQSTTRMYLKKLFRDNPVLFKEFKNVDDYDISDSLVMQYLIRYNEEKLQNNKKTYHD